MKERIQFRCYSCKDTFHNLIDRETQPTILLECPYCGAACKVDFVLYKEQEAEDVENKQTVVCQHQPLDMISTLPE